MTPFWRTGRSRLTMLLLSIATALALVPPPALSAQGDLDPSFGTGGVVQTDLDGPMLATPDGKLVVVGSDPGGMRVSRWLPSGALDTSFGTGGSVLIGLRQPGSPDGIYRQSTGAIVILGSYFSFADGTWLVAARLAANGAPDPSFGVGGLRILALGGNGVTSSSSGAGVGLQPDDSIVYKVSSSSSYQSWMYDPPGPRCGLSSLRRFAPDGGDDLTFFANLRAGFPSCFDSVGVNVALDRVGRAVGAGLVVRWNVGRRLLLMRWLLDGAPDPTLGGIGYVELPTPGTDDRWNALAFPPSSIAVAGVQQGAPIVGRYFEDGTLDPAFGTGGIATIVSPDQVTPRALLTQADGAYVVAGRGVRADGTDGLFLFRILPSGAPDPAFGVGGASFVAASPGQDLWAALQPDGKIVVAADGKLHRFIGLVPCAGFGDIDPASPFCPNAEWVQEPGHHAGLHVDCGILPDRPGQPTCRRRLHQSPGHLRSPTSCSGTRALPARWTSMHCRSHARPPTSPLPDSHGRCISIRCCRAPPPSRPDSLPRWWQVSTAA